MGSEEACVWVSRPQEVGDEQMRSLERMLDASEIERASKFRFEIDRRAYVVAHGLRRVALGDFLGEIQSVWCLPSKAAASLS